jgi:hypothetical protein
VKKAQQRLFNLRRLKNFGFTPQNLTNLYKCTIESILPGCSLPGTATAPPATTGLQWVARSAQRITEGTMSPVQRRLQNPVLQEGHEDHQGHQPPGHGLIILLPSSSWRKYRCIKAGTLPCTLDTVTSRLPPSTLPCSLDCCPIYIVIEHGSL